MGRSVTKNAQGELEVTESFSFSGSNPTLDSVKLIAVDGSETSDESPSWLGFTQSASGSDLDVTLQLDVTGLSTYTTYTFQIEASDDSGNTKSRRVDVGIGSLATSFEIKSVAGQEDVVRSDSQSNRIKRGGTARITLVTTMPATVDIEYVGNPSDEDDPTFTQSKTSVSSGKKFHEFFFDVNPSSLYAFEVIAEADNDQSVPTQRTDTFYFITGDTISVSNDENLVSSFNLAVISGVTSLQESSVTPSTGASVKDTADASASMLQSQSASLQSQGATNNQSITVSTPSYSTSVT